MKDLIEELLRNHKSNPIENINPNMENKSTIWVKIIIPGMNASYGRSQTTCFVVKTTCVWMFSPPSHHLLWIHCSITNYSICRMITKCPPTLNTLQCVAWTFKWIGIKCQEKTNCKQDNLFPNEIRPFTQLPLAFSTQKNDFKMEFLSSSCTNSLPLPSMVGEQIFKQCY